MVLFELFSAAMGTVIAWRVKKMLDNIDEKIREIMNQKIF